MTMENTSWDRLVEELSRHERIAAVEMNGPDLLLRAGGEVIRVTSDRDHGRTVVWAVVQQVPGGAMAVAAKAALDFNVTCCASIPTTMGLFVEKSVLLLGRSIELAEPGAEEVVSQAFALVGLLEKARAFVDAALASDFGHSAQFAEPHASMVRA